MKSKRPLELSALSRCEGLAVREPHDVLDFFGGECMLDFFKGHDIICTWLNCIIAAVANTLPRPAQTAQEFHPRPDEHALRRATSCLRALDR